MKLIIDIDNNVFTRLFDNGVDTSSDDREVIDRAVRNGMPYDERPQGEYVDISKLRLMTVEECAGHTIDYAMGWKACIEWIKKGGAEND